MYIVLKFKGFFSFSKQSLFRFGNNTHTDLDTQEDTHTKKKLPIKENSHELNQGSLSTKCAS